METQLQIVKVGHFKGRCHFCHQIMSMKKCTVFPYSTNQSINQNTFVMCRMSQANQRRIVAVTRQSVHVHCRHLSNSSVFKVRLKVLRMSADQQVHEAEFQIEVVLTLNVFNDNASSQHT